MGKEGQMHSTVKTYNLRQAAHKWEDNHNCRIILPKEREIQDPQQVPQSRDPLPGRQAPRTSGSDLPFRRARRLWEIETPLLECTQNLTCSESRHMGSDLKGAWSNFLANLGELPEGQEATGTPSGDTDAGGSHLGELIWPQGHWCWEAPFWSPPPGYHQHSTHQQTGTSSAHAHTRPCLPAYQK